jgi:hypothetical protein
MNQKEPSQLDKFKDLARDLEADEDEEHFEQTVKKIAAVPPTVKDEPKVG